MKHNKSQYDKQAAKLTYCPISGWFHNTRTGKRAGGINGRGYSEVGGDNVLCHRLAWYMYHGSFPTKVVHHINGNRSDNRITNLSHVSQSENVSEGYKAAEPDKVRGIYLQGNGRWKAVAHVNLKKITIGTYATKTEAIEAKLSFLKIN